MKGMFIRRKTAKKNIEKIKLTSARKTGLTIYAPAHHGPKPHEKSAEREIRHCREQDVSWKETRYEK